MDPYDKSSIADIERALMESDIGITPSNNGETIRLNIPSLTEDRRKELMKTCKALGEDGKVTLDTSNRSSAHPEPTLRGLNPHLVMITVEMDPKLDHLGIFWATPSLTGRN